MWVLVVDDVISNTVFMTEALKSLGHRSMVSHDAVAALTLLDQMAFDCIIVDFYMPHTNGAAFLASLREKFSASGTSIPVLVMTADHSPRLASEVVHLGARSVLHKPVAISALRAALDAI